jgi:hypothetical protein
VLVVHSAQFVALMALNGGMHMHRTQCLHPPLIYFLRKLPRSCNGAGDARARCVGARVRSGSNPLSTL